MQKNTNAIEKIRVTLYNLDLEITNSKAQSQFYSTQELLYRDDKTQSGRKKYIESITNLKKLKIYLEELIKTKNEVWAMVSDVYKTYHGRYKTLWLEHFIGGKSAEDLAEELSFSRRHVYRVLKKMREELITIEVEEK